MKKLFKVFALLKTNWKTLAGFEALYKILSLSIFTPLFFALFNFIMKITGYEYLTKENILSFLANPLTIAALLLLFVLMAVYTMIDIGAVIYLLDQSYQGRKAALVQTLEFAVRNAGNVCKKESILTAFVVLFLIPFLNIGVASSYVSSISIPEFILDFIASNAVLTILLLSAFILLSVLLFRWLYAFHYVTLEKCDFKAARKKSAELSKNQKRKDFLFLLASQFFFSILYFIFLMAGMIAAIFLGSLFTKLKIFSIVSASVVWIFLAVSLLIVSALGTPLSYACISILFYEHKDKRCETIIHIREEQKPYTKKKTRLLHIAECILLIFSVTCCSFYLYGVYCHSISVQIEYLRTMQVTAHRGASRFYPENTMAAFEGAKKLGADWIELDVQQSRDGQIFVMHDTNFKRTAGVDRNTWEMSYEEIQKLDAGSFFDSNFAGEQIPLLSEVIAFARDNDIKLNIELKPTGHEYEFEKHVTDIIAENQFENNCVITSQEYEVLEHVKAYGSDIKTVYVMGLAYGNINQLDAADHFSIEATSITAGLVSDVHNAGKELYAWTVNTEENINRMIDLNVDNIITDDVTLAKECIFSSKTSDVFTEFAKIISSLFT